MTFNADLSETRYELLNSLYDRLVTFRLKELNAAWKAIHDAETKLGADANAEAKRMLTEARKLATSVPVTEKEASDPLSPARSGGEARAEGRRQAGRVRAEVGRLRHQELRRSQGARREGADGEVRLPPLTDPKGGGRRATHDASGGGVSVAQETVTSPRTSLASRYGASPAQVAALASSRCSSSPS